MVEHGPVRYCDENEGEYVADFVPVEKRSYPFRDAVSILDAWFKTHPEGQTLRNRLTISHLSCALKAKKRAELVQRLTGAVSLHVETELRIGRKGRDGSRE